MCLLRCGWQIVNNNVICRQLVCPRSLTKSTACLAVGYYWSCEIFKSCRDIANKQALWVFSLVISCSGCCFLFAKSSLNAVPLLDIVALIVSGELWVCAMLTFLPQLRCYSVAASLTNRYDESRFLRTLFASQNMGSNTSHWQMENPPYERAVYLAEGGGMVLRLKSLRTSVQSSRKRK